MTFIRLILVFVLLPRFCYSQKTIAKKSIDSLSKEISLITESYKYDYGLDGKDIIDFRMDSTKRELIRVIYRPEIAKTFLVTYYFQNNYLIKVETISRVDSSLIGVYYFSNNKLFARIGKNYKTGGKGFAKISPKNIYKQLDYIYYQFEFFNMNNKKLYKNPPELLQKKREEIEKDYHTSAM